MTHFEGADSKKTVHENRCFSEHIKASSSPCWSAALAIQIVIPESRFRISRIMLSAITRCVLLSRNMVSPLWSAICTTVSTSKAMARSKSSLACWSAAVWISGTMAAIFSFAIYSAICRISARCCSALPPCPSYVWMLQRLPGVADVIPVK